MSPKGAYKQFNLAPCTLPPSYTEPAIKLVGTMSVLKGEAIYHKLSNAMHCVLMGVSLGCSLSQAKLVDTLVNTNEEQQLMPLVINKTVEQTANMLYAHIASHAREQGLRADYALDFDENAQELEPSLSDILFYLKAESTLGMAIKNSNLTSTSPGTIGIVGVYDDGKAPLRSCRLCKFSHSCSIRAIGMTCHDRTPKQR
ncbi:hypothetical protein HLV38_06775 [Berryella wangjianweii]|uniref:Uncharacterized protein n=1 Tax=Berryella wangjianweii TaxID=2734634 RepID=A0A6M8JAI7_9ACTN|nr:hypothetical protein [Berryella wangjianweii]QKF07842.1 hypothetical protein HLV38_06775 [Berryella wangjianweii]